MSTPRGIEFDKNNRVLLDECGVIGIIEDDNLTVGEDE